jgi:hypothetical protein
MTEHSLNTFRLWAYPINTIQWTPGAILPGIKRQEREADHSPRSCAEVKNGRATPLLLHNLHGMTLHYNHRMCARREAAVELLKICI